MSEVKINIPNYYAGGLWVAHGMIELIPRFNYLLNNRLNEIENLINGLLIYGKVTVPTDDFMVIFSLIKLLGQSNIIELINTGRLNFVRLKGLITYACTKKGAGLVVVTSDKTNCIPIFDALRRNSSDLTINMGLMPIDPRLTQLIMDNTIEVAADKVINRITQETSEDLANNADLKETYGINSISDVQDINIINEVKKLEKDNAVAHCRIYAHPEFLSNKKQDGIDKILQLSYANLEFYMSDLMGCQFSSTFVPVGHFLKNKQKNVSLSKIADNCILDLLDFGDYPNVGNAVINKKIDLKSVLNLENSNDAQDFKKWFHQVINTNPNDIKKEAFKLHRTLIKDIKDPKFSKLRFAATNILGLIPGIGTILGLTSSAIESFVLSNILKRKSPLYFLDDLYKIIPDKNIPHNNI